MSTSFFFNGREVSSDAMEGQQIDANDVLNTGAFSPDRDVVVQYDDGTSKLVNPGSKFTAKSGSRFQEVPSGKRG